MALGNWMGGSRYSREDVVEFGKQCRATNVQAEKGGSVEANTVKGERCTIDEKISVLPVGVTIEQLSGPREESRSC